MGKHPQAVCAAGVAGGVGEPPVLQKALANITTRDRLDNPLAVLLAAQLLLPAVALGLNTRRGRGQAPA